VVRNLNGDYETMVWTQVVSEPGTVTALAAGLTLLIRR